MKILNKNQKGITLIALVLTIIVLIILAGIGISVLMGENGVINKAKEGAEKYTDAAVKEKIDFAVMTASTNSNGKIDRKELKKQLKQDFPEDDVTIEEDEETGEITIKVKKKEYTITSTGRVTDNTTYGKDTSKTTWDETKTSGAVLDIGETTNLRLKKIAALANGVSEEVLDTWTVYNSVDTYITSIVWSETEPTAAQKVNYGQLAMTAESVMSLASANDLILSEVPIYAWYENGTIYIWSKDSTITMHPHSERMFQGMKNLQNISALSHFETDRVETVRCMFKDTKISNFSVCNDWDVTNVKWSINDNDKDLPGNNGFYWMCNNTLSNSHPQFSRRTGSWDSEGTFISSSQIMRVSDITVANYGQYIDIGTNIIDRSIELQDGTTPKSDWRVFKKDDNGVWLILSSYMPNSSFDVTTVGLEVSPDEHSAYGVTTRQERAVMINGLNNSNWIHLIDGSSVSDISGVRAKGAFELEEWIKSWEDKGYTNLNTRTVYMQNYNDEWSTTITWGYYVYRDEESDTTTEAYIGGDTAGCSDTLYMPHKGLMSNVFGYRLASPSAYGRVDVNYIWPDQDGRKSWIWRLQISTYSYTTSIMYTKWSKL